MGAHSLKFGGDFRQLGIKAATETSDNTGALVLGGSFSFDRLFTSRTGVGGREFAPAFGLPVDGYVPYNLGEGRVVHALLRRLRTGRLAR